MSRWFRLYDEVLDDPKVQRLADADFKSWVNLLCLASRHGGSLPSLEDVSFALRFDPKKTARLLDRLAEAGLIDVTETGAAPHGWSARQYKSDVSTERVKRFRERKGTVARNVDETFHATPPETEADTETESKKKEAGVRARKPREAAAVVFAFEGSTIRLTRTNLENWRSSYSAIPDLEAELRSIDAWLDAHPAKQDRWFHSVSGMLNRKHQEITAATVNNGYGPGHSGIPI